jgi:uncharacterized ubiquitin-like protein YukD
MDHPSARGSAEQTVQVRVQVVDVQSFTLDLQLPTYQPAQSLTQWIARDAGLDAHWADGRRRLYWLRARGRLLQNNETLGDMGVVPGELVYLLPEPPHGDGVLEQDPDYPETHEYTGSGFPALLFSLLTILVWSVGWGLLLTVDRSVWAVIPPALGLGLQCCNFARHAWGGVGNHPRIPFTGLFLFWMLFALAFIIGWGLDQLGLLHVPQEALITDVETFFGDVAVGFIIGMVGVFVGWLAWWGAVEPLPVKKAQVVEAGPAQGATAICAICNGAIASDVRFDCPNQCGRSYHIGCHRARISVSRGDSRYCVVCNGLST